MRVDSADVRASTWRFDICSVGRLAALAAVALALSTGSSEAQNANYCLNYAPARGSNYAYANRGTRCEGAYDRDNAGGASLTLVSLTKGTATVHVGSPNAGRMLLSWSVAPSITSASLAIQGVSIPSRLHYRMDTRVTFGSGSYAWPMDVLTGLNLSTNDVLLTASVPNPRGGDPVHVPLQIGNLGGQPTHYVLKLIPVSDVNEVFYAIETAPEGHAVGSRVPCPPGYHSASEPFEIHVPFGSMAPGTYRIRITAQKRVPGRRPTLLPADFLFQHG